MMIEVNGKVYPLWGQFVEKKSEWIGGELEDFGDSMDRGMSRGGSHKTKITDITLKANGKEDAMFEVHGEDFVCGFSACHGGIGNQTENLWLEFTGYGGHTWRIKKPKMEEVKDGQDKTEQ